MRRIIIYAMGQVFEKYQKYINWKEIIAIADEKNKQISKVQNIPVINPKHITDYTFDYIAIFSNLFFEEIESKLVGYYFIPSEKIISWRAIIPNQISAKYRVIEYYKTFIKEFDLHRVLDIGMFFSDFYFSVEEIFGNYVLDMDGVGKHKHLMGKNLYRNIYDDIDKCESNKYDIMLLGNHYNMIEKNIDKLYSRCRYVLIYSDFFIDEIEKIDKILLDRVVVKRMITSEFIFWLIDLSPISIPNSMEIYVVTHKEYNVQCNDLYKPICVGDAYGNINFLSEKTGENISHLNEKINECTALYWIWKNSHAEFIGLNHYRRYFYNNNIANMGNYLDKERAYQLLHEYDIILPLISQRFDMNVLDRILESMDHDLCMQALDCIKESISKYQPEYLDAVDSVMNGYNFYPCHMFVMRKDILDLYCQWLFSFLIEAAEKINIDGYGTYDRRAIGFIAERLLTVWLLKQEYKIKELPYVQVSG